MTPSYFNLHTSEMPNKVQATRRDLTRSPISVSLFVEELHALLVAGLNVVESVDLLAEREKGDEAKSFLFALAAGLREGKQLSAALVDFPQAFSPVLVGLLQAAESSSDLPAALARYMDYEGRLTAVKQKLVSAAIYPAILVVVGIGVAAFLMGYVVPRFAAVYRSGGQELPWASALLLHWGDYARSHAAGLAIAGVALSGWAVLQVRQHIRGGTWWRLMGVIPGAAKKLEVLELSRLYLTLGLLLQAGMPILRTLELSRGVLPSERGVTLDAASRRIAEGTPLSEAFAAEGLSTPVAARLLSVGERSGQLGVMLQRTAEFHDGETARWIERFTKAFEPVLMAGIGIVVGLIVILLYMPIFDLAGALQ